MKYVVFLVVKALLVLNQSVVGLKQRHLTHRGIKISSLREL